VIGQGGEQTTDYGELLLRILTYPLGPLIYLPLLFEKLPTSLETRYEAVFEYLRKAYLQSPTFAVGIQSIEAILWPSAMRCFRHSWDIGILQANAGAAGIRHTRPPLKTSRQILAAFVGNPRRLLGGIARSFIHTTSCIYESEADTPFAVNDGRRTTPPNIAKYGPMGAAPRSLA